MGNKIHQKIKKTCDRVIQLASAIAS